MDVNSTVSVARSLYDDNLASKTKEANETKAQTPANDVKPAALYEKSQDKAVGQNTGQYPVDRSKVMQMINESEQQVKSIRKLFESLVLKQGQKSILANGSDKTEKTEKSDNSELDKVYGDIMSVVNGIRNGSVQVDEETRLKAQEDISEDGYYGVKNTSGRILDFAKAISGGDPSKIEKLRDAVKKGFDAVEKMWGDELPQISKSTYDAVMKGFDDWANESKGANNTGTL